MKKYFITIAVSLASISSAYANCEEPTGELAKLWARATGDKNGATAADCLHKQIGNPLDDAPAAIIKFFLKK